MSHDFMMKMVDLTVKHGDENTKNDDTVKTWELTNKGVVCLMGTVYMSNKVCSPDKVQMVTLT